ncbi:MAG: hypothetical protein ABEJ79_11610 [Halolamina sp.]
MSSRIPELVGAIAVAIGFVAVGDRGLAALLTLDRSLLLVLAVLSFVLGLGAARERRDLDRRLADTDDVEGRYEAPRPGTDLDERFAGADGLSGLSLRRRSDLRERVATAAVAALSGAGLSESAARERIDAGEWTDDPLAAWYLSPELGLSLSARLRTLVGGSRYRTAAAHAVDAIERIQTGEADAVGVARDGKPGADGRVTDDIDDSTAEPDDATAADADADGDAEVRA